MPKALALMYHDVVPVGAHALSGFNTVGADHYKISREQFEQHLKAISAAVKGRPVRITDDHWQASFLFTMDDGGASSMYVADQLDQRGWRGHFLIATDYIATAGFLSPSELRELAQRGHCIGSHTCSHPIPMWDCTPEQMLAEWRDSRSKLEDVIGSEVTCGSVPGGTYVPAIAVAAARAGYRYLFSSEPTSKVQTVAGCNVIGRYGVLRTTSAAEAAKLASGDFVACSRQQALWNTKKVLKKVAAGPYAAARKFVMRRRYADASERN
jgi:peptidoglycan/xylan/chitin deacetylase (PgdA/CDA1 family)